MRISAIRSLSSRSQSVPTPAAQRDFFGIADITNKEIAGNLDAKFRLNYRDISRKYDPLIKSRNRLENEDRDFDVTFGRMRYDTDNVAKRHGQYEPESSKKLYDTVDIKRMFVDEEAIEEKSSEVEEEEVLSKQENCIIGNPAFKVTEVKASTDIRDVLKMFETSGTAKTIAKYSNKPPLTFFFEDTIERPEISPIEIHEPITDTKKADRASQDTIQKLTSKTLDELEEKYRKGGIPHHELDPMSEEYHYQSQKSKSDFDFDKSIDDKYGNKEQSKHKNAFDYLKKIRASKIKPVASSLEHRFNSTDRPYSLKPQIKLDSQGFHDYSHQVPDWTSCRRVDLLNYLRGTIIYNNYDILAINKPYGIASHCEEKGPDRLDMNSLIQELATSMKIGKVYLAHRLDKTTTGVLLFATSQERANKLNKLFKADDIKKTYWCITKGVPIPEAALIDMPLGEFNVAGRTRSCPAPEFLKPELQLVKKYREAKRAVTEYRVLRAGAHVALVEVKPRTGVKHQIRCHLGFGLDHPILGDHKYSHIGRLAPQKLHPALLKTLHLRQEKVRTLPIHLHALSTVIPGAKANGETLFVYAPLPPHFADNLKTLRLSDDEINRKGGL